MTNGDELLDWLATGSGLSALPLLVVAAHPDDETIGFGGQIGRFPAARLLYSTDGAPRDGADASQHGFAAVADYAHARRAELAAALACAGIDARCVLWAGLPDQQATLHLLSLSRAIATAIAAQRPPVVVTHAYEGGHPDHDATCCAVHLAVARLGAGSPLVLGMAGYHGHGGGMTTGRFLPVAGRREITIRLSGEAAAQKRRMLGCFTSQQATLVAFLTQEERFRLAPRYDFAVPPHAGELHYERHPWGMTGAHFRSLAARAWRGAEMPPCAR